MFNTETNGANFQYIIHVKHRLLLSYVFSMSLLSVVLSHPVLSTHTQMNHVHLLFQPD